MWTFQFFENTGGMNLRANDLTIAAGEAEEITNLHATTRGGWSSDNVGYVNLNSSPLASGATITSLYEYITLDGQSYMMATAGTSLYTVSPATGSATALTGSLANDARMHYTTFKGLLILCNGVNPPMKWDGVNPVAPLGGWPPTIAGVTPGNPSISEIFSNRLVFSGDPDYPSMIYLSELENAENFTPTTGATSAGAIQVSPGDGEKITALKSLFLPLENIEVLVIFKERSIYLLSGSDTDTFLLQKLSGEFGAVSSMAVVSSGNELMFLSNEGVTSLSTATTQGNLTTGFLSDRIRPQIEGINRAALGGSFAVHLRSRQEVWWFVPDGSSTVNQLVLVYNYGVNGCWSRRSGITSACGAVISGNLYTGNYAGKIQQQLKGNQYNGQPIRWTYRTGFQDFTAPRIRKRIKDIRLYIRQISPVAITVNMHWDFRRSSSQRQTLTLNSTPDAGSSIYGSAVYGADIFNLAGGAILQFTPNGSGRAFRIELTGESLDQPIEIQGWTITTHDGGYA